MSFLTAEKKDHVARWVGGGKTYMGNARLKTFFSFGRLPLLCKAKPGNNIGVVDVDVDRLLGPIQKLLVVSEEDWWGTEGNSLDCCPGWQQACLIPFHKLDSRIYNLNT